MVSIIVCSINPRLIKLLEENIKCTIGVPYEIVTVDNRKDNFGICKVYNKGAKRAKYPFLCFVHEDVSFKTENWGKNLICHLSIPETGLIGVAGGAYKSSIPSSWSASKNHYLHIIQHYKHINKEPLYVKRGGENNEPAVVLALDGVFLATRKDVYKKCKFDEQLLKGFHGYDIDFSLQVSQTYKVKVVYDILLEHFSEGTPGKEWLETAILISKKWEKYLPASLYKLSFHEEKELYYDTISNFTWKMKFADYSCLWQFKWTIYFFKMKFLDPKKMLRLFIILIRPRPKNAVR